jgi:DNA-directed RNA polymerase I, II, and III subunit RPABC1
MNDEILSQYHLSRHNMLKVLSLRGYYVPEDQHVTLERFTEEYGECDLNELKAAISGSVFKIAYDFRSEIPSTNEYDCIVYWHLEHKLGVSIRDIVDKMEEENIKRALVVSDGGTTPSCNEIIKNLKITRGLILDVWSLKESLIYVPDHILVPQHRICSIQEKKKLFKAHGITKEKLPYIRHDDVMVKYLGACKGNLIEITKKSDTNPSVKSVKYRIVV